jgi:cysteine-rich repeat protein
MPSSAYFAAPCAGAGREAFFTVTSPIDGVVAVKVDATYNVSIGARPACPPSTSTGFLTCSNRSAGPGGETIAYATKAGTKTWIIVDAPGVNDRGSFALDVTVKGESCGDGLVSGAEQCDDGNLTAGDGCSPTCTLEPLAGADTCPGHAVAMTGVGAATRQKVVSLSTAALANDYGGTCGGSGRDGVVAVTSDIAGTMTAQLSGAWPTVFYARETCNDSSSELSCKAADPAKPNETTRELTFPVLPGVPVFLFVDGIGAGSGPATLSLTVTP